MILSDESFQVIGVNGYIVMCQIYNEIMVAMPSTDGGIAIIDLETDTVRRISTTIGSVRFGAGQFYNNAFYLPCRDYNNSQPNWVLIFDLETDSVRAVEFSNSLQSRSSHIYNDRLYILPMYNNTIEIFDLTTEQIRTVTLPDSTQCQSSYIYNDKLYVMPYGNRNIDVFDLVTESIYSIELEAESALYAGSSVIYNDKIYMISSGHLYVYDLAAGLLRDITLPYYIIQLSGAPSTQF